MAKVKVNVRKEMNVIKPGGDCAIKNNHTLVTNIRSELHTMTLSKYWTSKHN